MKREVLRLENIKGDLLSVLKQKWSVSIDRYLASVVLFPIIGILLIIFTVFDVIGILLLLIAMYPFYRLITEYRAYRAKRTQLAAATFSDGLICLDETFSHFATERIREPRYSSIARRRSNYAIIHLMYFGSGRSWRLPSTYRYYRWSKQYALSRKGLDNTSLEGDAYYHIPPNILS